MRKIGRGWRSAWPLMSLLLASPFAAAQAESDADMQQILAMSLEELMTTPVTIST